MLQEKRSHEIVLEISYSIDIKYKICIRTWKFITGSVKPRAMLDEYKKYTRCKIYKTLFHIFIEWISTKNWTFIYFLYTNIDFSDLNFHHKSPINIYQSIIYF